MRRSKPAARTGERVERRVAKRVQAQRWYLRFPRAVPVGIFLLVSGITALSVYAIEQVETQRAEAQDRQMAMAVTTSLERLANAHVAYLKAGAALLSTQTEVRHATFREFAQQVDNDESLGGGGVLAWAQPVRREHIGQLELAMRRQGEPDFTVHPRTTLPEALVVTYVEPRTRASFSTIGYDLMYEPVRRAAAEQAIRTGRPIASGSIRLVSGAPSGQVGFGVLAPVYRAGFDGHEKGQLLGVIARAFAAQDFLTAALAPQQLNNYGVALYDPATSVHRAIAASGPQAVTGRRIVRPVVFAGRTMQVELSPPPGTTLSNLSLLTLLLGMMVAGLLLIVARLVTRQASEDRAALAWFEEQASIRNSLTRELNHRVKNTLANVLSIVALTRRRTSNIDDFVSGLIGRVRALSATHDLLTQSEWGTTPIRAVVEAELAPYAREGDHAVVLRGPGVELAPNDALSLGLALHELATNASKYGALSQPGGQVEVAWDMMTEKLARIEWRERGGPPVPAQRRSGFGTELIEKIVAHELRNPVDLRFDPGGVQCILIVPVRTPAAFALREGTGVLGL